MYNFRNNLHSLFAGQNYRKSEMSGRWSKFITVLIIYVVSAASRSFEDYPAYSTIFNTDQYLFIGINHCTLFTERAVPAKKCPYYAVYQGSKSKEEQCAGMKMHLILTESEDPKVLILKPGPTFERLMGRTLSIPWPFNKTGSYFTVNTTTTEGAFTPVSNTLFYSEMAASLFDSNYRLLYVLKNHTFEEHTIMECYIFYVHILNNRKLIFDEFGVINNVHENNHRRFLWTEDPYNAKFYYVEKSDDDGRLILYTVPFRRIMQTLIDGRSGMAVYRFRENRRYISVSHNVLISYAYHEGRPIQFTKNLSGMEDTIVCAGRPADLSYDPSTALVLLFDADYCQLEAKVPITECMANTSFEPDGGNGCRSEPIYTQQWFLTCVVLFIMVSVVLMAVMCRCRYKNAINATLTERLQRHFTFPYFDRSDYSSDW